MTSTDKEVEKILADETSRKKLLEGFTETLLSLLNIYSAEFNEILTGKLEINDIGKGIILDLLQRINNCKNGQGNETTSSTVGNAPPPVNEGIEQGKETTTSTGNNVNNSTDTDNFVKEKNDINDNTINTKYKPEKEGIFTSYINQISRMEMNSSIAGATTGGTLNESCEAFAKTDVQNKIFLIFCNALTEIIGEEKYKDKFRTKIESKIIDGINLPDFKKRVIAILKNALYKNKKIAEFLEKGNKQNEQYIEKEKEINEKEQQITGYIDAFEKTIQESASKEGLTSISKIIDEIIKKPTTPPLSSHEVRVEIVEDNSKGGTLGETTTSQFNAFHFHKFPLELYTINILKCPVQKLGYIDNITIQRKYAKLGLVSTIAKPLYNLGATLNNSNECAYKVTKTYQQMEHFNHLKVYDDKGDHIIILYRDIMLKMIKFKNIIESVNSQRKDENYKKNKDGITKTFGKQQGKKILYKIDEPICNKNDYDKYKAFTYNYSEYLKSAVASTGRAITGITGSVGLGSLKNDLKTRIALTSMSTLTDDAKRYINDKLSHNTTNTSNTRNKSLELFKTYLHRDKLCIKRLNTEYTICVFYEEKDGPLYSVFFLKKVDELSKFNYNKACVKLDGSYNYCNKDIVIYDPNPEVGVWKTTRTTLWKNHYKNERDTRYYGSSDYMVSFSRNELFVSFLFFFLFYEPSDDNRCHDNKTILQKIYFLHYFDNILYRNHYKLIDANICINSLEPIMKEGITYKPEKSTPNKCNVKDIYNMIFDEDIDIFFDKPQNCIDFNETKKLFKKYTSETPKSFSQGFHDKVFKPSTSSTETTATKGGLIQHKHPLTNKQTQKHIIYKKIKTNTLKNTNRFSRSGTGVLPKNGRSKGVGKLGKTKKYTKFQRPRRQTKHRVKK